ncbi:Exoglucanase 1 [Symbiodinium microadriaticum]|uniref:Exoglucanase 1 n=1 Tax=Symbiodinium microadriaticum TaxID=2951 RepID=A0A1Q9EP71_SYMMI|nr:Exoglucanase 1 [Symbiodinium microadriaticum]
MPGSLPFSDLVQGLLQPCRLAFLDLKANNMATAYTPHPCNIDVPGQYVCEGTDCGDNDSGERYDGLQP